MGWYRLNLHVDRSNLRILCRKLCGVQFGPPRPGMLTLTGVKNRLIVTYRGQSVRLFARGNWLGAVSVSADAFCQIVESRLRGAELIVSFDQGQLAVAGHRAPAVWEDFTIDG
jgi:hypothetical protein